MAITRTDHNQVFDQNGNILSEQVVEVDITTEVVTYDIHSKIRAYLTAAATFQAIAVPTNAQILAQVKRNTKAIVATIRLLVGADLLAVENTDT